MTKKQILVKLSAYKVVLGVACLALVVTVGVVANAYQSVGGDAPKVVIENGNYIEAQALADEADEVFGSVASPDIMSKWIAVNSDTEYHMVVPFRVASSTFISFANPFGTTVTSTVELARLQITTAASSTATTSGDNDLYINCGAKASAVAGISTVDIINVDGLTPGAVGTIENNLTAALGGAIDSGTVAKIALTPVYPYFVCYASSTSGFFTTADSEFAGEATVVISRTR